jgi:hypothetical protein
MMALFRGLIGSARSSAGLFMWAALGACQADILKECVDPSLDGGCESVGDEGCSCDGWKMKCEEVRTKDYLHEKVWRSTGQSCEAAPDSSSGGTDASTGATNGSGAATSAGGSGNEGASAGMPPVDAAALLSLHEDVGPGLIGQPNHTTQPVIGYLNAVLDAPSRLALEPSLVIPPITYQGPCEHVSTIFGVGMRPGTVVVGLRVLRAPG